MGLFSLDCGANIFDGIAAHNGSKSFERGSMSSRSPASAFSVDNRSVPQSRARVLLAVCLGALGMPLCFTGPAVALPALSAGLGGSPSLLNWVTNAFMLSFGATLMLQGALADAYGRKRVFLWGLVTVIVSSSLLACLHGMGSMPVFVGLRAVQGLGSAAVLAGGTSALAQLYDGPQRARVFSLVGTSFGVGLAFGPLMAGWLLAWTGWHGVVLCVVPVALVSLVLAVRSVQESRNPHASGLDVPGAVAFTLALGMFTWAVLASPEAGWARWQMWVALLSGVAFVWIERRSKAPMLDLSLFRYPRFVGVQLLAAAPAYGFVVLLILLPVRFIGIEGMSPIQAGELMFALSLPMLFVPMLAGWLVRWVSAALLCSLGLLMSAAGLAWLAQCAPGAGMVAMAAPLFLIGLGMGLPWGLMDGLAISVVPVEQAGMATGIFSTVRVAGEGIALALVSAGFAGLLSRGVERSFHAASLPVNEISQQLVTGNLQRALAHWPGVSPAAVLTLYGEAFSTLLQALAGITLLTALVIYAFLRQPERKA